MKTKAFLSILLLLFSSALGPLVAQDKESRKETVRKNREAEENLNETLKQRHPRDKAREKTRGRVTVEYDRFGDVTVVSASDMQLAQVRGSGSLTLTVSFSYKGKTKIPASSGTLFFHAMSDLRTSWRFLRYRDLIVLADGERMNFGEGDHEGRIYASFVAGTIAFTALIEKLERIGKSQTVQLQLGAEEYVLRPGQIDTIADIAALMKTSMPS